ncbi:hypothetical protein J0H58_10600 [bacterium]|nr:hypothetical protein [bacterium]
MNVIRVWEAAPPAGVEALEWVLLTSEPVDGPGAIERAARWYACRMQIEEFHEAQKSEARMEGYQVQSAERMGALVAVVSVIAVGLLNARPAARDPEQKNRPAADVVPAVWVEVLSTYQTGGTRALDGGGVLGGAGPTGWVGT